MAACLQAVRVQLLDILLRPALPLGSKLQCAAAALEVWPKALDPSSIPPTQPHSQALAPETAKTAEPLLRSSAACFGNLTMLCAHATLQHMVDQLSPSSGDAPSANADRASPPKPNAGQNEMSGSDKSKHALHSWSRNQLTDAAALQVHARYHNHWHQLQQQQQAQQQTLQQQQQQQQQLDTSKPMEIDSDRGDAAAAVPDGTAAHINSTAGAGCNGIEAAVQQTTGSVALVNTTAGACCSGVEAAAQQDKCALWQLAAAAVVAELDLLSGGDEHRAATRWQQLQQALQLAVTSLGCDWAFQQVVC